MSTLTTEVISKLHSFQQRKLTDGEKVLLAKALTDSIPLPPADVGSIKLYVISSKAKLLNVIDVLSTYVYLDDEFDEDITDLMCSFMSWRFNIAYNPSRVNFTGEVNTIVDDFTGILQFINCSKLATVGDKLADANATITLFCDVVKQA